MEYSYDIHVRTEEAELRMTIDTPLKEAFLQSFLHEHGIPKVTHQ